MTTKLTIAICTYNRQEYVQECLDSLQNQSVPGDSFEILVIDNNSTDDTSKILSEYKSVVAFRSVLETKQGLSNARNAAIDNCQTPYLLYLDDDALADKNLVKVALECIEQKQYKVFGGVYLPWYKHGTTYWMKDEYVQSPNVGRKSGELNPGEYLSGGIFCAEVEVLKKYGGFNPELGMKGTTTAYGEETELQNRMRKDGIKLMLRSDLIIEHVVAPYKLDFGWFFKSAFLKGKDIVGMNHWSYSDGKVFKLILESIAMCIVKFSVNSLKLFRSDYFVENLFIDSFARVVKRVGMITRLMELKHRK